MTDQETKDPHDSQENPKDSFENEQQNLPLDPYSSRTELNTSTKKTDKHHSKQKFVFGFNVTYRVIRSVILFLLVAFILIGSFGAGIGMGYFAFLVSESPIPDKNELADAINNTEQVSKILYANGEAITIIKSDVIRTNVTSEQISPLVKQAIIATEDEYFEEHKGIVPKAVIRALISDATGLGGYSGGSTLTQQLIKQQVLTSETNYKRKANEILLALRLEKFFTKDEILTSYLNVSPFGRNNSGQNIAGIETAAQGIFGKSANELTLPEAAYLAGLPQSPITYNPYTNTGEKKDLEDMTSGIERKNHVLFSMYRAEMITKEEYEEALAYDITQDFIDSETILQEQNGFLYYYIQEETVKVLMPKYYEADGLTKEDILQSPQLSTKYYTIAERELRRNGYTVHTTIDQEIYDALQDAVVDYGYILDDGRDMLLQTGSLLLENKTGKILGFIGGRDYAQNQNNHAFQTRRSPASTMKPIIAYAPAIDIGLIGSESQLSNFPTEFKDGGEPITNYGGVSGDKFESVRDSLKNSLNIPVYHLYQRLLEEINPEVYFDKMNIKMSSDEFLLESIPMGGTHIGLTVEEQTAAYATLANQGIYNEPYVIEKIVDNQGNIIYEHQENPVEVFSKATASIMNDLMRDVIASGTGTASKDTLTNIGSDLAYADWVGKTGTSQDNRDYWFTASTPAISFSSWIGYDDNTAMYPTWGLNNMQFWAYTINRAFQTQPSLFGIDEKFELDSSVIKSEVSDFSGEKMGNIVVNNKTIKVPGNKVESLFAQSGASATQFKFGIGGTDANYETVWKPYLTPGTSDKKVDDKKPNDSSRSDGETTKPSESTTPSSSSN